MKKPNVDFDFTPSVSSKLEIEKPPKYRILESRGLFYIQTQVEENQFLQSICLLDAPFIAIINIFRLHKKPTYKWTGIDDNGNPITISSIRLMPWAGSFATLDKAKEYLYLITKPDVIHEL